MVENQERQDNNRTPPEPPSLESIGSPFFFFSPFAHRSYPAVVTRRLSRPQALGALKWKKWLAKLSRLRKTVKRGAQPKGNEN